MTHETAQQIKESNARQDKIAEALLDIRLTRLNSLLENYKLGYLTAREFLAKTDNIWQDELKQAQLDKEW